MNEMNDRCKGFLLTNKRYLLPLLIVSTCWNLKPHFDIFSSVFRIQLCEMNFCVVFMACLTSASDYEAQMSGEERAVGLAGIQQH